LLFFSGNASSQDVRVAPPSPAAVNLSFAAVAKRAGPAVVNVYAARVIENRNPLLDDPIFRQFFGGGAPGEQVQRSLGSGVIVDGGLVVTNNHVIERMDQVKVSLADKREFEAEIVLKDPRSDLAVLRPKDTKERFPAIELGDSDALRVGDFVLAIGNPFGVGQTMTHGIVSALARTQVGITDYQFFIQTDAAINPGNSGGALIDASGNLIGINSTIFSQSGGSLGIGFAIPVSIARTVLEQIIKDGEVTRGWFGVEPQDVSEEIAKALAYDGSGGVVIRGLVKGGPADRAGMQVKDIVVDIDGKPTVDTQVMLARIAELPPGTPARVKLWRDKKPLEVDVTVGKRPRATGP
jgi:Do/DeqQ family serine protease